MEQYFRRSDFMMREYLVPLGDALFKGFGGNISFEGLENFSDPDHSFVILPNHQRYFDIPVVYQTVVEGSNNLPYFIMGSFLPHRFLSPMGGISINRLDDVLKRHNGNLTQEKLRDLIHEERDSRRGNDKRNFVTDVVSHAVSIGENIVVFPEGCIPKNGYNPKDVALKRLLMAQEKVGKQLDFLPVAIDYSGGLRNICVRVGKPINVGNRDLEGLKYKLFQHISSS